MTGELTQKEIDREHRRAVYDALVELHRAVSAAIQAGADVRFATATETEWESEEEGI